VLDFVARAAAKPRGKVLQGHSKENGMWVLIGVPIVVLGFALRFNALLVVTIAGIATGVAGGLHPVEIVSAFGKAFADNRYMGLIWLTLPVIALLERNGLKEQARHLISRLHAATTGRVLMLYFVIRQITAALGLTSLGGHAQMVRPLIARTATANCPTRCASRFARMRRRSTISRCSSAKTFSSRSSRSC
jgi:uncharacterized membrane protein